MLRASRRMAFTRYSCAAHSDAAQRLTSCNPGDSPRTIRAHCCSTRTTSMAGQLVGQLNHAGFKDRLRGELGCRARGPPGERLSVVHRGRRPRSAGGPRAARPASPSGTGCLDHCPEQSATRKRACPRASPRCRRRAVGAFFHAGSHLATGCLLTPIEACILSDGSSAIGVGGR